MLSSSSAHETAGAGQGGGEKTARSGKARQGAQACCDQKDHAQPGKGDRPADPEVAFPRGSSKHAGHSSSLAGSPEDCRRSGWLPSGWRELSSESAETVRRRLLLRGVMPRPGVRLLAKAGRGGGM